MQWPTVSRSWKIPVAEWRPPHAASPRTQHPSTAPPECVCSDADANTPTVLPAVWERRPHKPRCRLCCQVCVSVSTLCDVRTMRQPPKNTFLRPSPLVKPRWLCSLQRMINGSQGHPNTTCVSHPGTNWWNLDFNPAVWLQSLPSWSWYKAQRDKSVSKLITKISVIC